MLNRFACASLVFFVVLGAPCGASLKDQFSGTNNMCANASTYHNFHIPEEALRAYFMLEKCMGGTCPHEVSSQDLLNAVMYLGIAAYGGIRGLAHKEEVEDLRTRLEKAYKEDDPDIRLALLFVMFERQSQVSHVPDPNDAADCVLTYANHTLGYFLDENADKKYLLRANEELALRAYVSHQVEMAHSNSMVLAGWAGHSA